MHSIADAGVQLLVIQNSPEQFPGKIYRTSYARALRKGLKEWEASREIKNIVVPQQPRASSATMILKSAFKTCSLPHQFVVHQENSLSEYLQRLAPDRRTGIIFDDDLFYARLCITSPEGMLKLFNQRRAMVMRRVTMPCDMLRPNATVDALFFPWKRLARRIAMDLSKISSKNSEQPVFEAEWHPRLPLSEVVQDTFTA